MPQKYRFVGTTSGLTESICRGGTWFCALKGPSNKPEDQTGYSEDGEGGDEEQGAEKGKGLSSHGSRCLALLPVSQEGACM